MSRNFHNRMRTVCFNCTFVNVTLWALTAYEIVTKSVPKKNRFEIKLFKLGFTNTIVRFRTEPSCYISRFAYFSTHKGFNLVLKLTCSANSTTLLALTYNNYKQYHKGEKSLKKKDTYSYKRITHRKKEKTELHRNITVRSHSASSSRRKFLLCFATEWFFMHKQTFFRLISKFNQLCDKRLINRAHKASKSARKLRE